MQDKYKTKAQLIAELETLRERVAELDAKNPERRPAQETLGDKTRLNQILLDALPCVALLLRPGSREIIASNEAAVRVGAVPGKQCFSTWGQRQTPCPWCLAPKVWDTQQAQHLEVEALDIVWDAHWIPVSDQVYMHYAFDITERKRVEQTLQQRNRDLELLYHVTNALNSTLDLSQVLALVLEKVRTVFDAAGVTIWLPASTNGDKTLICWQASGPGSDALCGRQLPPGKGIAGWVLAHNTSLIVPDAGLDERYYKAIERETGVEIHSVMGVPLRFKEQAAGVLEVVDTAPHHFQPNDLALVESLAATAAIAIENARLYEQAQQDAAVKAALLQEANHRVRNNLRAISGLFAIEKQLAPPGNGASVEAAMERLARQVNALLEIHELLSNSSWSPVRLDELIRRIIQLSFKAMPPAQAPSVNVGDSPVEVSPRQASSLGLIVNELATNTLKHALDRHSPLLVTVRITISDNVIQIEYRDNGPGYPEDVLHMERYRGGLHLIQRLVSHSLHGTLDLANDGGAVVRLQFKAEDTSQT